MIFRIFGMPRIGIMIFEIVRIGSFVLNFRLEVRVPTFHGCDRLNVHCPFV